MNKPLLSFAISFLFVFIAAAQPPAPDKNKVLDMLQEQQYEAAINYLQPAIGIDSSNTQALRLLSYAYYMSEDMLHAQRCFLKLHSLEPDNITANHYLASIYYNRDPDLSMSFLARLIRLQPANANYYRGLGEQLSRAKMKDSALQYLSQAYKLAPGDFKNTVAWAETLIDLKDYAKADSLLEIGLTRDSMNASLLKSRIRSAYDAKDYKSIPAYGERLISQQELGLSVLTKVVLGYYNLQQYENCVRVCEYMLSMELQVEAVYYYEAKALAKLKQYDRSNELLEICLDKAISKNGEMYYFTLGENYEAVKQYKKAVASYDTAFYLYKSPIALYNCGRIYEVELKNEPLARKYFTQYLALAKPIEADEKKAYAYVKERWGKKKIIKK
jgi:tetratricopeptide (TPR) repeat protein